MSEYWSITPAQMKKYVDVYTKKKKMEVEERDAINFNLGKYIAIAFHEPKKYPKRPFLYKEQELKNRSMTVEEMEEVMRRNTVILGGTIK